MTEISLIVTLNNQYTIQYKQIKEKIIERGYDSTEIQNFWWRHAIINYNRNRWNIKIKRKVSLKIAKCQSHKLDA